MIKNILFDLDGSLLPMDQEEFTRAYFKALVQQLAPLGHSPEELIDAVWKGTGAMVKNDGDRSNEETFWDAYAALFGEAARAEEPYFRRFYETDFQKAKTSCGFDPYAGKLIRALEQERYTLVLASNPIFPRVAQESRMTWAGVDPSAFSYITSYENSHYCKPNPLYYQEIVDNMGLEIDECLMVGNDATEDLAASELGMKVFLLTPCLINREGRDISGIPQGTLEDLLLYVRFHVLFNE